MEDAAPARRADPLSWAVFGALAAVYRWGRCPSFGPGDSAQTVYRALFAPNSDPLVRLARAVSFLPLDTPEGWINALSGLFHAGAAALLFGLLRRLGLKRLPALAGVALLAFSRRYWYYALAAGHTAAATFGFALLAWGVVAWKDEARPWPLAFSAAGALLFGFSAPAAAPSPILIWLVALCSALALQRLAAASPRGAAAVLAVSLVLPFARPYDLRRHNPTLEWAQEIVSEIPDKKCLEINDPGLRAAVAYAAARRGTRNPLIPVAGERCWPDPSTIFDFTVAIPAGLLARYQDKGLTAEETARLAEETLRLPALTSMGRRDRRKYDFTGESVLYAYYREALMRYARTLPFPRYAELRARLDAQLAEYEPGPAPKP